MLEKSSPFGRELVQRLWKETRVEKVVGSNSSLGLLDGHFFALYCCKNCNDCLKKTVMNQKKKEISHFL